MNDLLAEYERYNPGFQRMTSMASQRQPKKAPGEIPLPYVDAGLQAAGLLTGLYGDYKAGEIADENFEMQRKEFEYQRRMEQERIEREKRQQAFLNSNTSANRAEAGEDRLLSKYQGYFRNIGY